MIKMEKEFCYNIREPEQTHVKIFKDYFGYRPRSPFCILAPGRVNLIGEHVDYNDGPVLPMAIERYTMIFGASSHVSRVRIVSLKFKEMSEFEFKDLTRFSSRRGCSSAPHWSNYLRGVATLLKENGLSIKGFDGIILSDIPLEAGLSSSAALEVAFAYVLLQISGIDQKLSPLEVAKICQKAEREFVGTQCGLMDQVASIFAKKGSALFFDTRFETIKQIPFPKDFVIAIVNSGIRRRLAISQYNLRQEECKTALSYFQKLLKSQERIISLRDVTPDLLASFQKKIPNTLFRRARHVVEEIHRTQEAKRALVRGDIKTFGSLMKFSHESLRDLYEVSTPELDFLVSTACKIPGVLGARLTGAGFGGCIIALLEQKCIKDFQTQMSFQYQKRWKIKPEILYSRPADGVLAFLENNFKTKTTL